MSTLESLYQVVPSCDVEPKEFKKEDAAKDAQADHAQLCSDCTMSSIEINEIDNHSEATADSTDDSSREETEDTQQTENTETREAKPVEQQVEQEQQIQMEHAKNAAKKEIPAITPVEDKARSVIQNLDQADMTRLVWDPSAPSNDVPYNPSNLPYDRPEPSAEAFDMFATIIEGEQQIRYSVESVEFTEGDDWFGCSVQIEKQTPEGSKTLHGVKTRTNTRQDHWRERLYSKARRNALKQDIPPTWISTLLRRYKELE
jgi:hypothetical protein